MPIVVLIASTLIFWLIYWFEYTVLSIPNGGTPVYPHLLKAVCQRRSKARSRKFHTLMVGRTPRGILGLIMCENV